MSLLRRRAASFVLPFVLFVASGLGAACGAGESSSNDDATSDGGANTNTGSGDSGDAACGTCPKPTASCRKSVCNPATKRCEEAQADDGTSCDDGDACTAKDVCKAGACAGVAVDCSASGSGCVVGACDPKTGACTGTPKANGTACDDGDGCTVGDTCAAGACVAGTPKVCAGDACNDATCNPQTGACGTTPVTGRACDDANPCTLDDACASGTCTGTAKNCTAEDDGCNIGKCNTTSGSCYADPKPNGTVCNDGNACTDVDRCTAGICGGKRIFQEFFSDNAQGWTLDANWQIGAAVGGCGDPADDHTPGSDDRGIAGVVLGGCAPTSPVDASAFNCLTSPAVDTSAYPSLYLTYWRELYSDYTPFMKNKVEVYDGAQWTIVWETFGAPGIDDVAWTPVEHDVSAMRNASFRVRFCYSVGNAGVFNRGSWNVDDVSLTSQMTCQ